MGISGSLLVEGEKMSSKFVQECGWPEKLKPLEFVQYSVQVQNKLFPC